MDRPTAVAMQEILENFHRGVGALHRVVFIVYHPSYQYQIEIMSTVDDLQYTWRETLHDSAEVAGYLEQMARAYRGDSVA